MHRVRTRLLAAGTMLAALVGGSAVIAQSGDAAPEARYVMDAGTIAGMMGQGDQHELTLRLGSRLAPTGAPRADHFMPAGAKLGASVPLETPTRETGELPDNFQRPKGRLLLYWGCGAKAGPGQPVVIDFTKLAKGAMPPGLFSTRVPADPGPTLANSRTYGHWPNGQKSKSISGQSSLIGQHRIAGSYSPEIAFGLDQDFMAGLRTRSSANADGSLGLSWQGLGNATGYHAWMMGGKDMGQNGGDMVWWSSSATQEFGGGLWSWLAPATVTRLIGQKVVMPPSQTSCTVPAEVKQAAGGMLMGFLYAYGPEANFAFPERPRDPKIAWKPKWTARVRYRSMATFMPGMPSMSDIMSGRGGEEAGEQQPQEAPKKCKPKGLGGMLKKAAGVGC
ncbi:hypothetical protein FHS95_001388 [Sphingomonas naasensis]|uniref:hypothetical protein n=1 Tax=Sphingomonas naasensis TaxID=1344951 RepID=UPI0019D2F6E8|nr:hypothetical protein [Sphingomonas naasensis]NIJ19719.1 hypothetical protein [Sphingomonas naasensis]